MTPALEKLCSITSSLADKVRRDVLKSPGDSPKKWVVLYWFAKAAKSYEAARLLWTNGYWQDAAAIGRTILEVSLQALYFRRNPDDLADQFFAHATNQKSKLFQDLAEFANDEIKTGIEAYFKQLNIDPTRIKKWKNWWGKDENIWDMVEEIGAQQTYRSQYGPLSALVHGAPLAFPYYLLDGDRFALVDWKANTPASRQRILAATMVSSAPTCLLDVISVFSEIWGLSYEEDLAEARSAVMNFNLEAE